MSPETATDHDLIKMTITIIGTRKLIWEPVRGGYGPCYPVDALEQMIKHDEIVSMIRAAHGTVGCPPTPPMYGLNLDTLSLRDTPTDEFKAYVVFEQVDSITVPEYDAVTDYIEPPEIVVPFPGM